MEEVRTALDALDRASSQTRHLLRQRRRQDAAQAMGSLRPPDRAALLEQLSRHEQIALLSHLASEDVARILEELDDETAARVASRIGVETLAKIVDSMAPDEAADLLGDLEPSLVYEVLGRAGEPEALYPLLTYADDTAGGLMTPDYLALPQSMGAGEASALLSTRPPRGRESPYLFVVNDDNELVGVANVFDVLGEDDSTSIHMLMDSSVLSVRVGDTSEVAARLVARYHLDALPVVEDDDRLVGVITVADLLSVLDEEATEDLQRFGGSVPLRRPYLAVSVSTAATKRIGWLMLLLATGALSGMIIRLFQATVEGTAALAVFIPLLIGTGGNAGSQATATIVRALAVRDIALWDSLQVMWREFRTALLLGLMLAMGGLLTALAWGTGIRVSLVLACSLLALVVWSDLVGAGLPLLARRIGVDPALISGPLMSTVVDTTGLLIYLGVARTVLA